MDTTDHLTDSAGGVLCSIHYVNPCKSKLITTGLNVKDGFRPYMQLSASSGKGIQLDTLQWKYLSTIIDESTPTVFLMKPEDVGLREIPGFTIRVQKFGTHNILCIESKVVKGQVVYCGQVTCEEIVRKGAFFTYMMNHWEAIYEELADWVGFVQMAIARKMSFEENGTSAQLIAHNYIEEIERDLLHKRTSYEIRILRELGTKYLTLECNDN